MKDDHDHFIIVVALLPAVLFVLMYVLWQGSGEPDISSPNIPTLGISLPPAPDLSVYVPDGARRLGDSLRQNAPAKAPAIAVGLLVGVFGMGVLIDLFRIIWRRVVRMLRRRVKPSAPPEFY